LWLGPGFALSKRISVFDEPFRSFVTSIADQKFQRGLAALQKGDAGSAELLFKDVIESEPRHIGALNILGILLAQLNRPQEAESYIRRALTENSASDVTLYNYGTILKALKRPQEALERFSQALSIEGGVAETWNNRGTVLSDLQRHDEAVTDFDRALAIKPDYAEAWCNKGKALAKLKHYEEALAASDRALTLNPHFSQAWLGRANALAELTNYDEAFASYEKALALNTDLAEAWLGRGNVFSKIKRHDDALAAYGRALTLKPGLVDALFGRGNVYSDLKRHEQAATAYAETLKSDPDYPFAKGRLLHQRMLSCDWKGVDVLINAIEKDISAGKLSAEPFGWQGVARSQQSLQQCMEIYNKANHPENAKASLEVRRANHKKIRIGYSSGELRDQATSHLLVGVLELHDKSKFEVFAIDNGWDDQSVIRKRIDASVEKNINIRRLTDAAAAAAIREQEIDILVNLNGYFGEERTRVFAHRPAPIQVNYLGFPGTLGASYMDYIIADKIVLPEDHKRFYTEKVAYLPYCYQANDRQKQISSCRFTRVEFGLPEEAFVFCCFNNNYKILPDVFDSWARILDRIKDSVLWLMEDNSTAASNLKKEAAAREIDPQRIIFAKRLPLADHLARHKLADLFLDTLPYNAHTTASDALWAGLPVLTQIGETFAGRVAASLLNAIALPELITSTRQAYEDLAIELATNRKKLADIKNKLASNCLTTPLFDTAMFTRLIEAAFSAMYERYRAGLDPDHISISS
jgi:predicted O-linked N-acetylglucosamine transferase (SPINDLY family)